MATNAQELAERLSAFNAEVIAFVNSVPDAQWGKRCKGEEWSIGVVARHIGAGHYSSIELAKIMIAGMPLPELSQKVLTESANSHAAKHADCTRAEVLSILESKGRTMVEYVAGLDDAHLSATGYIEAFGNDVTVKRMLEVINLVSAGEHLQSMRNALAQG